MEHIQEIRKSEPAIERFTSEEEKEFGLLIEKINSEPYVAGKGEYYQWQIIEKFGERAVPYILDLPKQQSAIKKIETSKFLDTLVTGKTAPLVLKAMQDGKINIHEGAIPAAEGKEKTAAGLIDLLFQVNWPNNSGRGNHARLLDAISLCGVDELAPKIAEFYKKLRNDKNYAKEVEKHLKIVGNDLYDCDGEITAEALIRLGGPVAKSVLNEMAANGDNYIKKYAQQALDGQMYIGKPYKFLIKNPDMLLPKNKFYSLQSNPDLDDIRLDHSKEDKNYWPKSEPEKLTEFVGINFLDYARELNEDFKILENYFRGKIDVWKTLGALSSKSEAEGLQDFSEDEAEKALASATLLELFKSLTHLPDYTALRNSFDELEAQTKIWGKELEARGGKSKQFAMGTAVAAYFLNNFRQNAASFLQEDFRLPESAEGFILWHEKLRKERNIKPFVELFFRKIEPILIGRALDCLKGSTLSGIFPGATLIHINHVFSLYRDVNMIDVPIYQQAAQRLREVAGDRPQVFYGRDADYFYYAVKAESFGISGNKKPRKIYINRNLADYLINPDSDVSKRILAYLLQEKITEDAVHVDTGYRGSVPEAVLRALNPKLNEEEINDRIKLLDSRRLGRESISKAAYSEVLEIIEDRPHQRMPIYDIERDKKTGRLKVLSEKANAWVELEAWVVNQAIIRHFAPKKQ